MLEERRAKVLESLVEEYIATGEPVSSAAILERSELGVSSATVRNDLARLEAYGFVAQPHTSAGRIPTESAYRYYVDHCSPTKLRSATVRRIKEFFGDVHQELGKMLKETTSLIAELTTYPAVVLGPGLAGDIVRGLHLVQLGDHIVLVVVVTHSGRVHQEIARLSETVASADLAKAERILRQHFAGNPMSQQEEVATGLEPNSPVNAIVDGVVAAMRTVESDSRNLYLGGTAQLAGLWNDLAHVHNVLAILEKESSVLAMLGEPGDGAIVRIGSELPLPDIGLAVITAAYDAGEHGTGQVGVIGPTRMDYRRAMSVVEQVSDGLADSLGS